MNTAHKESDYFFNITNDLLCIIDKNGTIKKTNASWEKILGYKTEELKEINYLGLVHPDDLPSTSAVFKAIFENEPLNNFENRLLCKDGSYRQFEWQGKIINNLLYAAALDITEKRKNELLSKKSVGRFKRMLGDIKMMALILDAHGNIEFVNDFTLNITGYSRKEVLQRNIIDLFVSDPQLQAEYKKYFIYGSIPNYIELEIYTKNRWKIFIKWSVTELFGENGNFAGVALIGENITEFKLYEKILNFRYQLFEKEHENDINSLIRITLDKAEELTDSKLSIFLRFDEEEGTLSIQTGSSNTMLNTVMKNIPGSEFHLALDSIWAECIAQRKPVIHNDYEDYPDILKLPDGHSAIFRDLIFPVIKEDKIVALIGISNKEGNYTQTDVETVSLLSDSLWNILYKKRTSEALKKSEEQLRALNITKDKFFSIIAHDLKSPFQGMLGSLQILSSEFDYLSSDDKKGFIKSIDKLSQYTYKLLENLLEWSRVHTEQLEYNIQIINLKNALNDTIELLSNVAASKNININHNIPADYFVKTDLNVMLTIFRNFLSNAIKFTNYRGEINIYTLQREKMIEIFVKDNGTGMTEEELKGLFQIQNQQHKSGTGGETGTGLGLILCKEMIEKIEGSINVISEINKGTTFSFTLPKV
jgi:PAS domain S-box-containing protein